MTISERAIDLLACAIASDMQNAVDATDPYGVTDWEDRAKAGERTVRELAAALGVEEAVAPLVDKYIAEWRAERGVEEEEDDNTPDVR